MPKKRLGDVLTERSLLSPEELEQALQAQQGRLAEVLVRDAVVPKSELGAALEAVTGMPYIECPPASIEPEVLALIPGKLSARSCALPVAVNEGRLVVAMGEPQHLAVLADLEFSSGMKIEPRFSFRDDVVESIRRFYGATTPPLADRPAEPEAPATTPAAARGMPRLGWVVGLVLIAGSGVSAVAGWQAALLTQRGVARVTAYLSPQGPRTASGSEATSQPPVVAEPLPNRAALAPTPSTSPEAEFVTPDATPPNVPPVTSAEARPAAFDQPRFGNIVQVGVFRDPANVQRVADTLGQESVTVSVRQDGLRVVELGPFSDKVAADQAAAGIEDRLGLVPLVRRVRLD